MPGCGCGTKQTKKDQPAPVVTRPPPQPAAFNVAAMEQYRRAFPLRFRYL